MQWRVVQVYEDGKSNLPHTLFLIRFHVSISLSILRSEYMSLSKQHQRKQKITTYSSELYVSTKTKRTVESLTMEEKN